MKIQKPRIPLELVVSENLSEIAGEKLEAGYDVSNYHFKSGTLECITSPFAEFYHCIFEKCTFKNCDIAGYVFEDVIFRDCDLSNISFIESRFSGVEFINCNLTGTIMSGSNFCDITFSECSMRYSNFSNSDLTRVLLQKSNLSNSYLWEVKQKEFYLSECNLTCAEFAGTILKGVDFTTCNIDGILISVPGLKGMIVTDYQAVALSKLLGLIVR
jgi:uncharacterized protein YjbI with pentapeptide repeats